MACSGVRNSCESVATKSSLSWFARSASARAARSLSRSCSRSSATRTRSVMSALIATAPMTRPLRRTGAEAPRTWMSSPVSALRAITSSTATSPRRALAKESSSGGMGRPSVRRTLNLAPSSPIRSRRSASEEGPELPQGVFVAPRDPFGGADVDGVGHALDHRVQLRRPPLGHLPGMAQHLGGLRALVDVDVEPRPLADAAGAVGERHGAGDHVAVLAVVAAHPVLHLVAGPLADRLEPCLTSSAGRPDARRRATPTRGAPRSSGR